MAPVCPPREYCCAVAVDVREQSAENAKANAIRINHRDTEKYREKLNKMQLNRSGAEDAEGKKLIARAQRCNDAKEIQKRFNTITPRQNDTKIRLS